MVVYNIHDLVKVYPGQDEMGALAQGALRVLRGEDQALEYPTYVGNGE